MLTTHLMVLTLFLAPLAPAAAESWTNQAGRVLEAALRDFDGAYVTLARTNGASFRLPLAALCVSDQRRVRLQSAQSIAPAFVQAAYNDARSILDRFASLPPSRQTPEGRSRAVLMACSVFDTRLKARAAELQEMGVQGEVRRLRASLAHPPGD
jgi:hypothetical protein